MSIIYGIDLGTSNCLVAQLGGSGAQTKITCLPIEPNSNANSFKSVVHFVDQHNTLIGKEAESKLVELPDQTIELLKTRIGKDHEVEIKFPNQREPEIFSPQEISAIMLNHIHKRHPNKVKKAVLTVPADFDQNKKGITKQIGELSGIEIVELIEEPSAALMYYLYNEFKERPQDLEGYKESPQNYLVFDFGGGTLDLSLIHVGYDEEGNIRPKVLEKGGDMDLGGNTIDLKLCEYFLKEFFLEYFPDDPFIQEVIKEYEHYEKTLRYRNETSHRVKEFLSALKRRVEIVKIALSNCEDEDDEIDLESPFIEYDDAEYYISRKEFEEKILHKHFRDKVIQAIKDIITQMKSRGHADPVKVLFVGGSSRIPYFKKIIASRFSEAKCDFIFFEEYDTAIAKGAAILGAIRPGISVAPFALNRCFNIVGHDILVHHYGDEHIVIPRGKEFPFSEPVKQPFKIRHSLDTHIPIEIKENYSQMNDKRTIKIANFYHPFFYTNEKVTLSLDIDQHGLLRFTAIHDKTNEVVDFEAEKLFLLSDQELNQARKRINNIK